MEAVNSPFFVIFSLSRCGSTAIQRALSCHVDIRCAFEPDFSDMQWDEDRVASRMQELRRLYTGIKHVWDPSGWPFAGVHASSVIGMNQQLPRVRAMNLAVLRGADKVLILGRRNQLERTLSDLLGQQTELWGPAYPDGRISELNEGARYRAQLENKRVRPIDPEVVAWYLGHVQTLEDEFSSAARSGQCMELAYEELFGAEVALDIRLNGYRRLLEFLGFRSEAEYWNGPVVERLFHPGAKLNDALTLSRIPNLAEIRRQFSSSGE